MNKKFKNIRGITLVTLIITIVLLLILAGITIASLTGSGLFEKSQQAKQEQKNAQIKEEAILADYENKIGQITGNTREASTLQLDYENAVQLKDTLVEVGSLYQFDKNGMVYVCVTHTSNSNETGVYTLTLNNDSVDEFFVYYYQEKSWFGDAQNFMVAKNDIIKVMHNNKKDIEIGNILYVPFK